MKDLKTEKNVVYFNKRAEKVNKFIHSRKKIHNRKKVLEYNEIKYYTNLELICRKRFNIGKQLFMVNFTYVITEVSDDSLTIRDVCGEDENDITLPIKFVSNFNLPYCNTCHSIQGLSIKEPITIFDTNTPYVSRNWIWTAITRATDFNNITIFIHSGKEVERLEHFKLMQYFDLKIKGYKEQDKKCHRKYNPDDYISSYWICHMLSFLCVSVNAQDATRLGILNAKMIALIQI